MCKFLQKHLDWLLFSCRDWRSWRGQWWGHWWHDHWNKSWRWRSRWDFLRRWHPQPLIGCSLILTVTLATPDFNFFLRCSGPGWTRDGWVVFFGWHASWTGDNLPLFSGWNKSVSYSYSPTFVVSGQWGYHWSIFICQTWCHLAPNHSWQSEHRICRCISRSCIRERESCFFPASLPMASVDLILTMTYSPADPCSVQSHCYWCSCMGGKTKCWPQNLHVWPLVPGHHCGKQQVLNPILIMSFKFCILLLTYPFIYRATTALRLKFEVCKELRNHMELLPKTGYIQAQSQFSAQLKFLPRYAAWRRKSVFCPCVCILGHTFCFFRKSLFEEAGQYFDKETGVLEAPMTISVADQVGVILEGEVSIICFGIPW